MLFILIFMSTRYSDEPRSTPSRLTPEQPSLFSKHSAKPMATSSQQLETEFQLGSSNSCTCHSLFTLGACGGLARYYEDTSLNKNYRNIFKQLERIRKGAPGFVMDPFIDLSRTLPKMQDFVEPNVTSLVERVSNSLSFIPCNIYTYSEDDIRTCLKKRQQMTGRVLRIAFVGDSMVRNLMRRMASHLRKPLNLRADKDDKNGSTLSHFIERNYRDDLTLRGDGVEFSLYWASYLGQTRDNRLERGAKELLKTWAQNQPTNMSEKVPDVMYFDNGFSYALSDSEAEAAESVMSDFNTIIPYLKNLSRTTRLIYHILTPVKEWLSTTKTSNAGVDMTNQMAWLKLQDLNVWMWDTITPVFLRDRADCKTIHNTGLGTSLHNAVQCYDYQHPSSTSEAVAENLFWNYVCNDIMDLDQLYCCS